MGGWFFGILNWKWNAKNLNEQVGDGRYTMSAKLNGWTAFNTCNYRKNFESTNCTNKTFGRHLITIVTFNCSHTCSHCRCKNAKKSPDKLTIWLISMPLVFRCMLIYFFWRGLIDELRPGYQTEGKCTSMWAVIFNLFIFFFPKKCSVSADWFTPRGVFVEQPVNRWIIYDSIIKTPPLA